MMKKLCVIVVVLLSFIVLTGYGTTGAVCAAEKKEALNSKAQQNKAPERAVDPHAAYVRFHFQDLEMDFIFGSMILGATMNHGCEIGEAFYTAANIKDGDAASWQEQWIKMARRVEARGEQSLDKGRTVSARDQLQRASYYYRAALFPMLLNDPRFKETAMKSRALRLEDR
ncbi:MAG: hypothetical protein KJ649_02955 [Proteobacteria bacterium]|nr:hypothetical protein [Pseudomonadota bacterium]MBU1743844.1 hypothetical protein [Pseudomonadota bacterium]MBU1966367.1 hypothetical protein [Pseudomonadota bacterium]